MPGGRIAELGFENEQGGRGAPRRASTKETEKVRVGAKDIALGAKELAAEGLSVAVDSIQTIQPPAARLSRFQLRHDLWSCKCLTRLERYCCGPFLGRFRDTCFDPEDERDDDVAGGRYSDEFVDAPVGWESRLDKRHEVGLSIRKDVHYVKHAVGNQVKKIDALSAIMDNPYFFFRDQREDILVEVVEGGRKRKRKKSKVTVDLAKPGAPDVDVREMMKWSPDVDSDQEGVGSASTSLGGRLFSFTSVFASSRQPAIGCRYDMLRYALTEGIPKLHTLELVNCKLQEVPPVLREVATLKVLRLSHNLVKVLSEEWLWPEQGRPEEGLWEYQSAEPGQIPKELSKGIPYFSDTALDSQIDGEFLSWGATVVGREVSDEAAVDGLTGDAPCKWLEVKQGFFLPLAFSGKQVLVRQQQPTTLSARTMAALPRLEQLLLDNNLFYSLEVGALSGSIVSQLQVLNLSHNKLNFLPHDFMDGARELKYVDLSHNAIVTLPEALMECDNLEILFLTHNHLERLPNVILTDDYGIKRKRLRSLRKLFAPYNQLTYLPEDIGSLHRLEKLRVMHNSIKELPESLASLEYLQELTFDGNPLQQPVRNDASIEENMENLAEFWRQRKEMQGEVRRLKSSGSALGGFRIVPAGEDGDDAEDEHREANREEGRSRQEQRARGDTSEDYRSRQSAGATDRVAL